MLIRLVMACALVGVTLAPARASRADVDRWRATAARVSIIRDDWGIAHVHGKTDADAVFGMIYAQAEDDYNRVETNYLNALGRAAEYEGEDAVWRDLRQRLFLDPAELQRDYARSPAWLRQLMDAWADGLNYYLATHPAVQSHVITPYQPWMALAFSEGSIGGDIERGVPLDRLRAFYDKAAPKLAMQQPRFFAEPTGSNGIAIAPARSADGHALLWINPHTSFYFRSELQMSSDAGLDAYGAVTWGQLFIYQGFNRHVGWMHTSSGVDNIDEFAETIVSKGDRLFYRYGDDLRPVTTKTIDIAYRRADGTVATRTFTTYATHHGPIVGTADGKWIALALMNRPIAALQQSYLRTKASDYADYLRIADAKANSSNNTIFADDKGEIAYLHPQFVPIRDDRFDYTRPVDGSDPATDWRGLHPLSQIPDIRSPTNGWVFNTNDWPWVAAGAQSPKARDFPRYMDQFGENPRGTHLLSLLPDTREMTPKSLTALAFDSYLPFFDPQIPALTAALARLPAGDPSRVKLAAPAAMLAAWDRRWSIDSQPTSLAVFWGEAMWDAVADAADKAHVSTFEYLAQRTTDAQRIAALDTAVDRLTRDFGGWRVGWGRINRYQRTTDSIDETFSDARPSLPIAFTSNRWGSLASFGVEKDTHTRCHYGTSGNSFVAVVDFGKKVSAWAVSAGGESGDPRSSHFDDQVARYARGDLRKVYFYPEDLAGHIEQRYRPGTARTSAAAAPAVPSSTGHCGELDRAPAR
ncbi:acylase [Sphingomonas koreensis]|nr:acylase [Sphingomonas koreensis]